MQINIELGFNYRLKGLGVYLGASPNSAAHSQSGYEIRFANQITIADKQIISMKTKKEILNIETLAMFERLINRESKPYDIDMMVMPGTLEDKHKNCETIPALRRQFNLIYLLLEGEHDVKLGADHLQLNPNDLVIVPENTLYASDHIKNCKGLLHSLQIRIFEATACETATRRVSVFSF